MRALAVLLVAACTLLVGADAPSAVEQVDKRIAKNDQAIADLQAKKAELEKRRDDTRAQLDEHDRLLKEVGRLSDEVRKQAGQSRDKKANPDTVRQLREATDKLTPMQQARRGWLQTLEGAEAGITDSERRLAGLDKKAQELAKQRAKAAGDG